MTDFDPAENAAPLPSLAKLRTIVTQKAGDKGLRVGEFLIDPAFDPAGPHLARTILFVDPDWAPPTEGETPVEDDEFARVLREAEIAENEAAAEKARESLKGLADSLKDPSKGIGL